MKKLSLLAGICVLMFLTATQTAEAGPRVVVSFGFGVPVYAPYAYRAPYPYYAPYAAAPAPYYYAPYYSPAPAVTYYGGPYYGPRAYGYGYARFGHGNGHGHAYGHYKPRAHGHH
jgi:hypothetical protein